MFAFVFVSRNSKSLVPLDTRATFQVLPPPRFTALEAVDVRVPSESHVNVKDTVDIAGIKAPLAPLVIVTLAEYALVTAVALRKVIVVEASDASDVKYVPTLELPFQSFCLEESAYVLARCGVLWLPISACD